MAGSGFCFRNMEPDSRLLTRSNLKLIESLTLGPSDAEASGVIERIRDCYVTTIEVRSRFLKHAERAAGVTAQSATDRALRRLEDYLHRWRRGTVPAIVKEQPVSSP